MSIDYNELRARVEKSTSPSTNNLDRIAANVVLEAQATRLGQEVLRLHDGLETIRDRCTTLAKNAEAAGINTFAREMDAIAESLTGLLEGNAE